MAINYYERIPNNVGLGDDRALQRALERWQPRFLEWWREIGPRAFRGADVYLRTATGIDEGGWASYGHVRLPEYRWGIFLADRVPDRRIGFGDAVGEPVWQQVPGEHRNALRRLIVTQGDTEPASVEQQRLLGQSCPSVYDLRNLFQVNVEEGRHLWAMVYLLHSYFMFTFFTDRDGKFQLLALAESAFDPLARTTRFMLTEEAHHMFVGETGVARIVERTASVMAESKKDHPDDLRKLGVIDLATMQKYLNLWYSVSLDLFGGEISSNAASFFAAGLKGRVKEDDLPEHRALESTYPMDVVKEGKATREEVPLRNAMNEVLRDAYVADSQRGVDKWNRILEGKSIPFRLTLPSRRFHRHIGLYADVF